MLRARSNLKVFSNFATRRFTTSCVRNASDALRALDTYRRRHVGPTDKEVTDKMLPIVNSKTLSEFVATTMPDKIRFERPLKIEPFQGFTESELLDRLKEIASKNVVLKSVIGRGYYGTLLPPVIQRNILENPGWYTSYTPYQPEISQGRLESLLNFQTVVKELTGMDIANASLLDEATAAAEAMVMSYAQAGKKKPVFYVDTEVLPQTVSVLRARAEGQGIKVVVGIPESFGEDTCGVLVSYPSADGSISDWKEVADKIHAVNGTLCVSTDLLALTILEPPSSFDADVVLGSSQRFGVPMGFGGPHAGFFAVRDSVKRKMPGRLVGVSKDRLGEPAYRLALQTREQHIRRDKATSNICTAQALLANISAMYAVYHGPHGLRDIASRVHALTCHLADAVEKAGHEVVNKTYFDTLTVKVKDASAVVNKALSLGFNLYQKDESHVAVSLDETITASDFSKLCEIFGASAPSKELPLESRIPYPRTSAYLEQPVFNTHHSETQLLRYTAALQAKDLSLSQAMIPLGSCTMKLNATVQMMPITWPEFSNLHPFAPLDQVDGYTELIKELEADLADITGFAATSLQPNSGAQGEFTGLRTIRGYLKSIGQGNRNICLIPVSAHGTNPASAAVAGMKIVPVKCHANGELDINDLKAKAQKHKDNLAAFMVTYPSTYGVFEPGIKDAIDIVHENGGQVYMDGANMNAQVGLTSPGDIGADVCHLNLHKTFCIPHGGGGPGVGPICVREHLVPFLPGHVSGDKTLRAAEASNASVSAAPWGSASILPISWAYIKLMGQQGLKNASEMALLNANYMASRLKDHYQIAFVNSNGRCAHEFILDMRPLKDSGVEAIDVAKRLQDYGFHAPTMSWPVPNTLMVEPTESESLEELDRFCDAMISIRGEIQEVVDGKIAYKDSVLAHAPHPARDLLREDWDRKYTREKAAYPVASLKENKFWPAIARVDDTFGDLNLFCTCDPVEEMKNV